MKSQNQQEIPSANGSAAVTAAWVAFAVSLILLAVKIIAYRVTNSMAVLSDALESVVNVVASLAALITLKYVSQPADEDHPYGHGKLEFFSAAFEGGLIAFAALMIGYESIRALIMEGQPRQLDIGLILLLAAAFINFSLSVYLKKIANQFNSEALGASAAHVMSDVWTTLAVLLGLLLVKLTHLSWLDPVIALLMAIQLGWSGFKIVRKSAGALIDEIEPEALEKLCRTLENTVEPWVIDIHKLRMLRSGSFHHVDAHMVVPEFWSVMQAHEELEAFNMKLDKAYQFSSAYNFHLDPCQRKYCEMCTMQECPVRQKAFVAKRKLTVSHIVGEPK